jgi:hypothetical protein
LAGQSPWTHIRLKFAKQDAHTSRSRSIQIQKQKYPEETAKANQKQTKEYHTGMVANHRWIAKDARAAFMQNPTSTNKLSGNTKDKYKQNRHIRGAKTVLAWRPTKQALGSVGCTEDHQKT